MEKELQTVYAESKETILPSYTKLAYIPQAIFIRLGMILNLSFSTMYAVGKLGNLLLYIFVMFWAIHMAQTKKMFLSFLAVTPTALYLASSYTYDTVVFSFLTLACVLWANMIFYPEREYRFMDIYFNCFAVCNWLCIKSSIYSYDSFVPGYSIC